MTRLVIGSPTGEHIAVVLPETMANPEGWYQAHARIHVQGFNAEISFYLELTDVATFAEQLATLYESLSGNATLDPCEGQLRIECCGNGRGDIAVSGHACSAAGSGNRLEFAFTLDQTFLPEPLRTARSFVAAHQ